jgi:hypothetical protein
VIFRSAIRRDKGTLLETYTPVWVHPMTSLVLWTSMFLLCYTLSFMIMKAISDNGPSWLCGRTLKRAESQEVHRLPPPQIELRPAA